MTNKSPSPSAPIRITHATPRDARARFLPEHEHCFPERPKDPRSNGGHASPRTDFPETGTPDVIRQSHVQEEEFERSEQLAASERIVPVEDSSERIEPEQDDWLDKDAAR